MKARRKWVVIVILVILFAGILCAVSFYLNVHKKNMRLATMYPLSGDLSDCQSEFYQAPSYSPFVSNLYDCGDPSAFCNSGDPSPIIIYNNTPSPIWISGARKVYLLCKQFTPIGTSASKSVYAIAYDPDRGTPVWTYYQLTKTRANGSVKRNGDFYMEDQLLALGIPQSSAGTYESAFNKVNPPPTRGPAVYAKGHLTPAGDSEDFIESLNASFSFANAVPQQPSMNSGVWGQSIEGFVRNFVRTHEELYVITGAYGTITNGNLISPTVGKIGDPTQPNYQATIPACMYKIIISKKKNSYGQRYAIAFLVPNVDTAGWAIGSRLGAGYYAISLEDLKERMRKAAADLSQDHNYYFNFDNLDVFSNVQDSNFWQYWKFPNNTTPDGNKPKLGELYWYDNIPPSLTLKHYPFTGPKTPAGIKCHC